MQNLCSKSDFYWKLPHNPVLVPGDLCPRHFVRCGNTPLCYRNRNHCDGTSDCPDDSDESRSRCPGLFVIEEILPTSTFCEISSHPTGRVKFLPFPFHRELQVRVVLSKSVLSGCSPACGLQCQILELFFNLLGRSWNL